MHLGTYAQHYVVPYVRARWVDRDDTGTGLIELALLVALIAVVCILAITILDRQGSGRTTQP